MIRSVRATGALAAVVIALFAGMAGRTVYADEPAADSPSSGTASSGAVKAESGGSSSPSSSSGSSGASAPRPKYPPYADVLKEFESSPGPSLIKLHQKGNTVYGEIESRHLNRDFIVLTSIARGIGEGSLLAGMTWGFGDDWLWQFRKVDDRIQIVRRNVRFRAARNSPEERAVKLAYTDSVLFSIPISTVSPSGASVIDLSQVFMTDLPQISQVLPGFVFSSTKSSWAAVKGFKDNVELEVAATYASSGMLSLDTVPDSRGVSVNVHYSISLLPETGYTPRLADDRVGYFVTALKDFSKREQTEDRFVRYINRWDLQKADPSAELSPPKKPIIFWIEKTVPYKFRKPIRDGILEWNRAFEKIGFADAIHVHDQPDNAEWDPEDINYNTFRWITAGAGFAMGPSRVNPETGQILDADIIFDADFVTFWRQEYETFTADSVAALTGGPLDVESYEAEIKRLPLFHRNDHLCRCELHSGRAREFALGAIGMMAAGRTAEELAKEQERMILQGLKEVTMHEVGHTLGLRHNFKASTLYTLAELNDPRKTRDTGLTASVMDYTPTNIVPKGEKQGDYYSQTIGPYDMWAIEYGYKPFSGGTEGEQKELKKIAARAGERELAYATDEDTRGIDPDPLSNRFDLSKDPVEYAKARVKLVSELVPGVIDRVVKEGDGFQRARQAFGILLGNHGQAVFMAARSVGGLYTTRSHKGDPDGKPPFTVVPADKQREALAIVETSMLSDKPFSFPPELYAHMASTQWNHWGSDIPTRTDYAVHDVIALWQSRVLDQLLSSTTLARLHDSELKVDAETDAFTVAELFERLNKAIFAELDEIETGDYSNRKPAVSSLRRNLQRGYLKRMGDVALGNFFRMPEDCQTVAYYELKKLDGKIKEALASDADLDAYTRAHLEESSARINKVLDSRVMVFGP